MITVQEALATVLARVEPNEAVAVPLHESLGAILAEDIASDVDMPPFHKSAMDGFAVIADDLAETPTTLKIVEDIPAGVVPTRTISRGQCARIMTGAPVPQGADTVVLVEDTQSGPAPDEVTILKPTPKGKNICWKAEDVARGDLVLRRGHRIRPPEIATLAACGRARVSIYRRPTVAVLSTGDEVVPIEAAPQPGQIRDTNSHYLAARLRLPRASRLAFGAPLALGYLMTALQASRQRSRVREEMDGPPDGGTTNPAEPSTVGGLTVGGATDIILLAGCSARKVRARSHGMRPRRRLLR